MLNEIYFNKDVNKSDLLSNSYVSSYLIPLTSFMTSNVPYPTSCTYDMHYPLHHDSEIFIVISYGMYNEFKTKWKTYFQHTIAVKLDMPIKLLIISIKQFIINFNINHLVLAGDSKDQMRFKKYCLHFYTNNFLLD